MQLIGLFIWFLCACRTTVCLYVRISTTTCKNVFRHGLLLVDIVGSDRGVDVKMILFCIRATE